MSRTGLHPIGVLGATALAAAVVFATGPAWAKSALSTPSISCGDDTQTSIDIIVTAGSSGLPAGFTLQWMSATDLAALGGVWPSGTVTDPTTGFQVPTPGLCQGSFSGNANLSRYNLTAGQSTDIEIGDILLDEGASVVSPAGTDCGGVLTCGTDYVFRAFGHATNSANRSAWTATLTCHTLSCDSGGQPGCALTQGFWKTHGGTGAPADAWFNYDPNLEPNFLNFTGNFCSNSATGPITGFSLGTVPYTKAQLLAIWNTKPGTNALIQLAHQLMAAKLNELTNASSWGMVCASGTPWRTTVDATIAAADALIGGLVIPPVGSGFIASNPTISGLINDLTNFNEGTDAGCTVGPPSCDTATADPNACNPLQ
jgi:hypothetical protein